MSITRTDIKEGNYPLSSAQSRIWFMENLNMDTRAYNDPYDYKIKGKIDPGILEKSVYILMARHESFRTVFRNDNGNPRQVILADMNFHIEFISLENEEPRVRDQKLADYSFANSQRKFNLENGPLFYVGLFKISEEEHLLLINFHHIISDAVSIRIFLDELFDVYHAESIKKPVELPDIPINYRDFAIWETEWLKSAECSSQIAYWKKELEGIPDQLQLPFDFPRPKQLRFKGAEYYFRIDEKLRAALSVLSKHHGTSLLVPMMSAYAVLLSKYSLQNDIVIGVPVANRSREELQMLVGVLINSLPMRFNINNESSFVELIESTRARFMMAYENKSVPFEKLVDELKIHRSLNSSPIFQVLFNYLTAFEAEIRYEDLVLQQVPGERNAALVDLTLTVLDQKTWANCVIQYDTDLFRRETIERMAGHYLTILQTVAGSQNPVSIGKIPMLTPKEKDLILEQWNDTKV
ncbi:MAG: condensation domain-containing protein, partial [Syntrophothermus sp.]